jgi:hypothetical protein
MVLQFGVAIVVERRPELEYGGKIARHLLGDVLHGQGFPRWQLTDKGVRGSHIGPRNLCEINLEMIGGDSSSSVPLGEHLMRPAETDGRAVDVQKGALEDSKTGGKGEPLDWGEIGRAYANKQLDAISADWLGETLVPHARQHPVGFAVEGAEVKLGKRGRDLCKTLALNFVVPVGHVRSEDATIYPIFRPNVLAANHADPRARVIKYLEPGSLGERAVDQVGIWSGVKKGEHRLVSDIEDLHDVKRLLLRLLYYGIVLR